MLNVTFFLEGGRGVDASKECISCLHRSFLSFHGRDGFLNQCATTADLITGTTETVSNTVNWAVLHLARNQDVQRRMQDELDEAVGRSVWAGKS